MGGVSTGRGGLIPISKDLGHSTGHRPSRDIIRKSPFRRRYSHPTPQSLQTTTSSQENGTMGDLGISLPPIHRQGLRERVTPFSTLNLDDLSKVDSLPQIQKGRCDLANQPILSPQNLQDYPRRVCPWNLARMAWEEALFPGRSLNWKAEAGIGWWQSATGWRELA